jgi:predicted lipoprotein with Yx(FWY)xxD motif
VVSIVKSPTQEVRVRNPSVVAAATLAVAALAVAGCGSSSSKTEAGGYPASSSATQSTAAPAANAAVTSASGSTATGTAVGVLHTSLGTILVAGPKKMTVYLFEADKGSTSTCSEACAQAWPPVTTTGEPKAEGGAAAADLGTTTRSDGTKQVTYKGHPLYYYVTDQQSGETTGQGVNSFGAAWYVLSPKGNKIDNS